MFLFTKDSFCTRIDPLKSSLRLPVEYGSIYNNSMECMVLEKLYLDVLKCFWDKIYGFHGRESAFWDHPADIRSWISSGFGRVVVPWNKSTRLFWASLSQLSFILQEFWVDIHTQQVILDWKQSGGFCFQHCCKFWKFTAAVDIRKEEYISML